MSGLRFVLAARSAPDDSRLYLHPSSAVSSARGRFGLFYPRLTGTLDDAKSWATREGAAGYLERHSLGERFVVALIPEVADVDPAEPPTVTITVDEALLRRAIDLLGGMSSPGSFDSWVALVDALHAATDGDM